MALDRIILTNFRNHRATELAETRQFNLLVGDNGAGKTNVLEALSLLAPGRGLRRAGLADIPASSGPGGFAVNVELQRDGGTVRLGTGTNAHQPARRIVQANGADIAAVQLGDWLSLGWLTPAMDRLFADSAGARRRFLDRLVLAIEPGHARNASRLEAALRERNRLLSAEIMPESSWFDALELQLAEAGAAVAEARARMIEALSVALERLPEAPFARPLLDYQPGGPVDAAGLVDALRAGRARDRAAQRTLTGPHRDELAVILAGKHQPAAECSTGEQKAMLIAIVLAHSGLLDHSRPSVLLLDEVAAHLDPLRRAALFERLRGGPAQVWLTGTELAPFEAIAAEAAVWEVSGGTVSRQA